MEKKRYRSVLEMVESIVLVPEDKELIADLKAGIERDRDLVRPYKEHIEELDAKLLELQLTNVELGRHAIEVGTVLLAVLGGFEKPDGQDNYQTTVYRLGVDRYPKEDFTRRIVTGLVSPDLQDALDRAKAVMGPEGVGVQCEKCDRIWDGGGECPSCNGDG